MIGIFSTLKDKVAQYFDVHIRLIKLEFIERTSNVLGLFVFITFALLTCLLVMIFMGLGLAALFTHLFDSAICGYFATMGVFLLVLLLIIGFRRRIKRIFVNLFIGILTEHGSGE